MTEWFRTPFRPGAVRFEVENEAGVLYGFDEANRSLIKKSPLGKLGPDTPYKAIAALAEKKLFIEFRVTRDVLAEGFVALGSAPTTEELGKANWLPEQVAELSLPSGQLRMETAISLSLGPDPADTDGLMLQVPPGEYRLTLFRRAEGSLSDDGMASSVPPLILTLTPLSPQAESIETFVVTTQPAPPPLPRGTNIGKYEIKDDQFTGQINNSLTNCDRRAVRQLGIRFGDVLRVSVQDKTIDAWYLDRMEIEDLLLMCDSAPELRDGIFTRWGGHPQSDRWEVLWLMNGQGSNIELTQPVIGAKWPVVRMTFSSAPKMPIRTDIGKWSKEGTTLCGQVLTCASTVLTLNFGAEALDSIEFNANEERILTVGDHSRRLILLPRTSRERPSSPVQNHRCQLHQKLGDQKLVWLLQMKRFYDLTDDLIGDPSITPILADTAKLLNVPVDDDFGESYIALVKQIRQFQAEPDSLLDITPLPFADPPALCATLIPHWSDSRRTVLWIESEAYIRDYKSKSALWNLAAPIGIDVAPGTEVRLDKVQ